MKDSSPDGSSARSAPTTYYDHFDHESYLGADAVAVEEYRRAFDDGLRQEMMMPAKKKRRPAHSEDLRIVTQRQEKRKSTSSVNTITTTTTTFFGMITSLFTPTTSKPSPTAAPSDQKSPSRSKRSSRQRSKRHTITSSSISPYAADRVYTRRRTFSTSSSYQASMNSLTEPRTLHDHAEEDEEDDIEDDDDHETNHDDDEDDEDDEDDDDHHQPRRGAFFSKAPTSRPAAFPFVIEADMTRGRSRVSTRHARLKRLRRRNSNQSTTGKPRTKPLPKGLPTVDEHHHHTDDDDDDESHVAVETCTSDHDNDDDIIPCDVDVCSIASSHHHHPRPLSSLSSTSSTETTHPHLQRSFSRTSIGASTITAITEAVLAFNVESRRPPTSRPPSFHAPSRPPSSLAPSRPPSTLSHRLPRHASIETFNPLSGGVTNTTSSADLSTYPTFNRELSTRPSMMDLALGFGLALYPASASPTSPTEPVTAPSLSSSSLVTLVKEEMEVVPTMFYRNGVYISVSDPETDDVRGFTAYKITIKLLRPNIPNINNPTPTTYTVYKRYREFRLFYYTLQKTFKPTSSSWPEFPRKSFFDRFNPSTITTRLTSFSNLLTFISLHPTLHSTPLLAQFLNIPIRPPNPTKPVSALQKLLTSSTPAEKNTLLNRSLTNPF
ncbi:hypothetical protein BC829DRAFT_247238 [Chytridium lagenaria]|nr:hypothetical protein BC829DRAFT_247238 [Chytridium lagenaria]